MCQLLLRPLISHSYIIGNLRSNIWLSDQASDIYCGTTLMYRTEGMFKVIIFPWLGHKFERLVSVRKASMLLRYNIESNLLLQILTTKLQPEKHIL